MKIYTITCMTKLEQTDLGWPYFGSTAFMGFYSSLETATQMVENNVCGIDERYYNYAVIEEVEEGLYPLRSNRWFFEYNSEVDQFELIPTPKFMDGMVGIL